LFIFNVLLFKEPKKAQPTFTIAGVKESSGNFGSITTNDD